MAAKRVATSELNHDNWDEYEAEDAGTFKRAPEDVIQNRVIKTAKRRNPSCQASDEPAKKPNVFSNFGGFSKAPASSPFAFLSNLAPLQQQQKTNGVSSGASEPSTGAKLSDSSVSIFSQDVKKDAFDESSDYYAKLKGLNESVSQWIKTHVDKNPFCILSPVFRDYERYLKEIEHKADKNRVALNVSTTDLQGPAQQPDPEPEPEKQALPLPPAPTSIFGNTAAVAAVTAPMPSSSSPATGFSFGPGKPFVFSNVARQTRDEERSEPEPPRPAETEPEDEDTPPKADFTPVQEDGNVYSQRCKVFVKRGSEFADRGVGQLFLKPVAGGDKTQLLVRADTNLGNVLLNLILSEAVPMQRTGSNNVMLVCVPTPESTPPPVPVLLRVKTAADADRLLAALRQHRK